MAPNGVIKAIDVSSNVAQDAEAIGPSTALLCEKILADRLRPEQGFRAASASCV
jgi:hypothetical protein